MGSQFDEIMSKFAVPQLMHHFSNRDADNAAILMTVFLSGEEEGRDVEAFIQQDEARVGQEVMNDFETEFKVERKVVLMRRVDVDGDAIAMDTDMLVVVPDGSTIKAGRWGVEAIDNADGTLASVTLMRHRPKSYHATGYRR